VVVQQNQCAEYLLPVWWIEGMGVWWYEGVGVMEGGDGRVMEWGGGCVMEWGDGCVMEWGDGCEMERGNWCDAWQNCLYNCQVTTCWNLVRAATLLAAAATDRTQMLPDTVSSMIWEQGYYWKVQGGDCHLAGQLGWLGIHHEINLYLAITCIIHQSSFPPLLLFLTIGYTFPPPRATPSLTSHLSPSPQPHSHSPCTSPPPPPHNHTLTHLTPLPLLLHATTPPCTHLTGVGAHLIKLLLTFLHMYCDLAIWEAGRKGEGSSSQTMNYMYTCMLAQFWA